MLGAVVASAMSVVTVTKDYIQGRSLKTFQQWPILQWCAFETGTDLVEKFIARPRDSVENHPRGP